MTDTQGGRPERPRNVRSSPKGTVILRVGEYAQRGRIANLGRDGLLAMTPVTVPEKHLGRNVEIDLRLDDQLSEWLRISGNILRIGATSVEISFEDVPAPFVRLFDEIATASHAHLRILSVVLVDSTSERRASIAEGFRSAGCSVVEVSTPLEAIVRLGESSFEPDLIAIADSSPSSTSHDLRRFVEREHPRAKLVTIGDDLVEPIGLVHWLSSMDPGSDLVARVRQVLTRPPRA